MRLDTASRSRAFTLLEMLFALFVFGIVSAIGSQTVIQMIQHPVRSREQLSRLTQSANAYQRIAHDCQQALGIVHYHPALQNFVLFDMPVSGYEAAGTVSGHRTHWGEPRLFWHMGIHISQGNPLAQTQPDLAPQTLTYPAIASVGYYLKHGTLWRIWSVSGHAETVHAEPLLHGIRQLQTEVWVPFKQQPLQVWPQTSAWHETTPRGIMWHILYDNEERADWLFLMPAGYLIYREHHA